MDRPGESERGQHGVGGRNQPQAQGTMGGDYYEPAEQVGGGSIAGGGGSMQARMQYGEGMRQEGQNMDIVPVHLSELVPTHPHHASHGKEAGAEGHTQQHRGTEQQSQPQQWTHLPKDLGAAQVIPGPEESYPNPTGGGGVSYGGFPGAQPTKKSAGGARDREGEQYGRVAGVEYIPHEESTTYGRGDIGLAGHREVEGPHPYEMEGAGQRELGRYQTARRVLHPEEVGGDEPECAVHGPGDIGLAAHQDIEGPHPYEMEGAGEREPGREQLAHRVYSPAPPDLGREEPEGTKEGHGEIGLAAYHDVDGPHLYEMEGVGRREEGRAPLLRAYEKAHPSHQAQGQETQGTEKKE